MYSLNSVFALYCKANTPFLKILHLSYFLGGASGVYINSLKKQFSKVWSRNPRRNPQGQNYVYNNTKM